jgi:hypothetical protein
MIATSFAKSSPGIDAKPTTGAWVLPSIIHNIINKDIKQQLRLWLCPTSSLFNKVSHFFTTFHKKIWHLYTFS